MRRPSPLIRNSSETDINAAMTPMIDVVFLLLVFFVWTASFQIVEYVLPSELSAQMGSSEPLDSDPPPTDDFEDLVIRISVASGQPSWTLNNQPVASLDNLEGSLKAIASVGAESTLILHPDSEVPLGIVIDTYDTAQLAGFTEVSFAVNP